MPVSADAPLLEAQAAVAPDALTAGRASRTLRAGAVGDSAARAIAPRGDVPPPEAGLGALLEAGLDAGLDARVDARVDASPDAARGANLQARLDAGLEVRPDANLEAGLDARVDARVDASPDAARGANLQARLDAGLEVRPDANLEAGLAAGALDLRLPPADARQAPSPAAAAHRAPPQNDDAPQHPPPPRLHVRDVPPRVTFALEQAGVHPLLARLLAARGVRVADELDDGLARLLPPSGLLGALDAGRLLADAIDAGLRICVIADYDCDGATACAVALRGLAMLGARRDALRYVVPDRAVHGYGLTPAIVDLARALGAVDLLMTVDNGIASIAGVAHARALGMAVLVTDHHLPAVENGSAVLPAANVIVNPNQPGCCFDSKALAGVGVAFYVLLAARAELRLRGRFDAATQPRLDALLDLVALGTVADVVKLDANNRRLVAQGLKRVRSGRLQPGLAALLAVAGRVPARASAFDFGFAVGPRINAAGRLADMTLGIECLLTDDPARAAELAAQLDTINRERRVVEAGMRELAEAALTALSALAGGAAPTAVCLYDDTFHEGVVGIVAGRVKDRLHRPTFAFARGADGALKGSGRSIAGFHLRDALDLVAKRHPGLLLRFGGHAMAAGCTLTADGLPTFDAALALVAAEWLDAATLTRTLRTDGPLALEWFNAQTVALLDAQVWGQGFDAPVFCDDVQVLQQRLVGDKHLKLKLRHAGTPRDAIWFGRVEPVAEHVRLAFRLSLDEWNGQQRVQMVVEAVA